MAHRRLPIGIQTFRKLREQNCYYVDKTPYIQAGHDWSQRHPVVRLSFGGGSFTGPDVLEAGAGVVQRL